MGDFVDITFAARKPWRSAVAIAICLGSALCAAVAIFKNWHSILITSWVWVAWADTAVWLQSGRWLPSKDQWRMLNKTPGQIYQQAKHRNLPSSVSFSLPIAKVIHHGSRLLVLILLVEIVRFFVE